MSNQDFTTELFVDVTEEQQQMVAGGDGYSFDGYSDKFFKDFIKTAYESKEIAFALDADVVAGKGGAVVSQSFVAKKAAEKAKALKDVFFKF